MPWATIFDNVYLPLRLAGMPRARADGEVRAGARDGRPFAASPTSIRASSPAA